MKIEWDVARNVISVGKAEYTGFIQFKNSQTFASKILADNDISMSVYNTKERNKQVADLLGCSRSVLFKHFDKLQKKAYIAPVYDVLKKVSKFQNGQRWDITIVWKVNRHKTALQEVYNDGLYNLLPFVAELGLSPKELKVAYKGVWKVISKNSLHKNKLLVKRMDKIGQGVHEIPATLLKYQYSVPALKYLANNFKGSWSKQEIMEKESRYFHDCERLAGQLGEAVDSKWTVRRLKEEHDRMSKEITARKYSKDVFESVKDIPVKEMCHAGYKATLLDSAFAVADEGNSMGHCVAGYADDVREGTYLVYSITKDGERSSTVGIFRRAISHAKKEYGQWNFQQQYGRYNASVKDVEERELAKSIVEMLNKPVAVEI